MERNWIRSTFWLILLASLGFTVYQYVRIMSAYRSSQSPVAAAKATQQQISHFMANPWLFFPYLALLLVLLFYVIRQISRKTGNRNDFWFLAALLVAVVSLVRNFLRFH
jgi:uncharacterized membrane protein